MLDCQPQKKKTLVFGGGDPFWELVVVVVGGGREVEVEVERGVFYEMHECGTGGYIPNRVRGSDIELCGTVYVSAFFFFFYRMEKDRQERGTGKKRYLDDVSWLEGGISGQGS